jgi:hypothetical protein
VVIGLSVVVGLVLAGIAVLQAQRPGPVAFDGAGGGEGVVARARHECPDALLASPPTPAPGRDRTVEVQVNHVPEGFTLVTRYLEDRSFAAVWSPPVPDDLEEELLPRVEDVRLYARGDWAEAESYFVVVPLPTSAGLGCFVLRTAAAQDRSTGSIEDEVPEEHTHWAPPPTREPADPRARAVSIRGHTAVLTPGEAPTHLTRLVWLEPEGVLLQVLAENMREEDVLEVAENLGIRVR